MSRYEMLANKIRQAVSKKDVLTGSLEHWQAKKDSAEVREQAALTAKEIVIQTAKKTQLKIGECISELANLALAAVFEEPYKVEIEFVERRGQTEADIYFVRDGVRIDPMTASGGGALDIASFALRLAVWSLGKSRPLFILDEPFRNLSLDLQEKAGLMLKALSEKMGIQVIMVSHNPEIISGADKVIRL